MSSSQETCLAAESATEIDSEGSSGEERGGSGQSQRRLLSGRGGGCGGGDADGLPKKRRKQSTPVKFSTSLVLATAKSGDESEEDAMTDEGKPSPPSPPTSSAHSKPPTLKDENLNKEFRCQLCSQFFDSRAALELHLECDHQNVFAQQRHRQQRESSPEQPISPVNLSGLSIRNFAANAWGQMQQQQQPQPAARNSNHFPAMPAFPPHLAQFLPIPGFPVPDPAQIQRAAMGQLQPPKIFNLDAYCELCNKEFCNKYFLKTHKANKHGIYSDPPASQSGQGSNDGPPSSPFVATSPIANLAVNVTQQQQQQHRIDNNGTQLQQQQQQQLALPCDICPKRFKNEDSLRKHRNKIHFNQNSEVDSPQIPMSLPSSSGEEERQSPGGMESLFKQEISIDQDEASYPSTPRPLTVSPPSSAPPIKESLVNGDRWRRIGVMNPEAFCELCYKEYCNKYFLRTHKLKRHGIFIRDDKSPQTSPEPPGSAATWHQVQTSPLNLIMDIVGNGAESGDRNDECSCKSCGIRLQTQELYNLHMEKIHEGARDGQLSPKLEQEAEASDRTESISEDLQKLQTMILQLNNLESNKAASCALCGKDYDSPDALRSHMVLEHKVVPENLSCASQALLREKSSPTANANNPAVCAFCEKEYPNQEALRKHVGEEHRPTTPPSSTPQLAAPSAPATPKSSGSQPAERKPVVNVTPTSSYCEICNKELCNKYFMKTHMQKMHGIEIENGAQIGGVVCNICKKELCSKYFLRVHKQNTHGIVEEGSSSAGRQDNSESSSNADDVALRPEQLGDVNIRYVTHFTEVCPICNRRFRSPKWLKGHLQSEHGEAGQLKWREIEQYQQSMPRTAPVRSSGSSKQQQQQQHHANAGLRIPNGFEPSQQMRSDLAALNTQVLSNFFGNSTDDQPAQTYRCSQPMCSFSTPILALFFLHERSHSQQQESAAIENERAIQCPICSQSFSQLEQLRQHVATRHPNPFPGLLSQFPIPLLNDFGLVGEQQQQQQQQQQQERNDFPDSKEDIRQASPLQHIKSEVEANKALKQEDNSAVQVMPQGAYKCFQCGFTTANLNRIKKHIKKDHKSLGDPQETALAELSKTLKDVANKHKVPASYAMPQDSSLSSDKLIMQPFIIEEQISNGNSGCNNGAGDESPRRFAPALVFLPVRARLGSSLSITFSLNPA